MAGRARKILKGTPIWGAARPIPSGSFADNKARVISAIISKRRLSTLSTGLAICLKTGSGTVTITDILLVILPESVLDYWTYGES